MITACLAPVAPHRCLNIGCGGQFDERWHNLDLNPQHPNVRRHDVLSGPLPFADEALDLVYHAHVLEHLPRAEAPRFLRECRRVLRPGGTMRVVVPDLEGIVRLYVDALTSSDDDARRRREWLLLEMYDQVVRDRSGGGMLEYLRQYPDDHFALERLGADGPRVLAYLRSHPVVPAKEESSLARRVGVRSLWTRLRERCLRWLLGEDYALLMQARFRRSGELHRWMYDRHSLRELLDECGFVEIEQVDAWTSRTADWRDFHLDTERDGSVSKPDSLYMEASRE